MILSLLPAAPVFGLNFTVLRLMLRFHEKAAAQFTQGFDDSECALERCEVGLLTRLFVSHLTYVFIMTRLVL